MPKVLFVIHFDSYFAGLIDLARMLALSGQMNPVMLFPQPYPNLADHINICRAEKLDYYSLAGDSALSTEGVYSGAPWLKRSLALIGRLFRRLTRMLLSPFAFVLALISQTRQFSEITGIIRNQFPDVLILGGDIVGHNMALYIKAGHALKIPSVILPGWMASPREPAELIFHNPEYFLDRPLNWLFGKCFPQWIYEHKGRKLLRLPASKALALELLHLAPPLPWVLHSGDADIIAVESEAAKTYGISLGLTERALSVVGSRTHDILAAGCSEMVQRRNELCDDLGLCPNKRLVLCALPPDMLYGETGRPECEFRTYQELVTVWISTLCQEAGGNVVVSLHPSADKKKVQFIEKYGARISRRNVAELIPLCNIYVACISATIQWAIACARPVINYDVYRFRFTDYAGLGGVITTEDPLQFANIARKLIQDESYYREIAERQAAVAGQWGRLDGCAGKRILTLLEDLMTNYPSREFASRRH